MVRKMKISNVIERQEPQEATPEPEEHVNTTTNPTEVAVFEATHELPPDAAIVESAATVPEPPTPKPKRPPRRKKEPAAVAVAVAAAPTTPPIDSNPPAPEVEHPAEEIKIAAKAKAKPRAKPKAKPKDKPVPTQDYPTHDDEGQRIRPPPSMEKPTRPETPEQFWNSTLKNMKDKKDRQYASLIQAAF